MSNRRYHTHSRRRTKRQAGHMRGFRRFLTVLASAAAAVLLVITAPADSGTNQQPDWVEQQQDAARSSESFDLKSIPDYTGSPYTYVNGNVPYFSDADMTTESFERYSELDALNRCQTAFANINPESMPDEEREEIGSVRPTGWHTVKYPEIIRDRYLYNRCHLIAFSLAGENANPLNLITGTRYMNVSGMLPFENAVSDYVDATGNHVLYRVTPEYEGTDLIARGVLIEARSVEDGGGDICFCVFCYNVQPGIEIDYSNGDSRADGTYTLSDGTYEECGYAADTPDTGTYHGS